MSYLHCTFSLDSDSFATRPLTINGISIILICISIVCIYIVKRKILFFKFCI